MLEGPPQTPDKEAVIKALRADSGLEDLETKRLLEEWISWREAEAEKDPSNSGRAVFESERAEIYLAMGDRDEAAECLRQALYIARQENDKSVYDQVVSKIDELGLDDLVFS